MDMIEPTKPVRVMPSLPLWGEVGDRMKSYKVKTYLVEPLCEAPLSNIQLLLWRRFVLSFTLLCEHLGDPLLETIVKYDVSALNTVGVRVYVEPCKSSKRRLNAHGACEKCGNSVEQCECS